MLYKNMISLSAIVCMGIFSAISPAWAGELAIQRDYPLEKLTAHVSVIHGPNEEVNNSNQGFHNNSAIIDTNDGFVVIDPGSSLYSGEMIVNKIRGMSSKPIIAVFITHEHGDHWLGNHGIKKHYPNAVIYVHENTRALMGSDEAAMWIKSINRMTGGQIEGTKVVAPDKVVKDGDEINLGGITFRIYNPGKAHSNSDIMVEIIEDGVLVTGDILRDRNLSMYMSSFAGNLAALDVALKTAAKVYVPGHGRSGDKALIAQYRAFILDLKAEVRRYLAAGLSDFEMKPKVIKALNKYSTWSGFEENIGRLINRAYLEVEYESF